MVCVFPVLVQISDTDRQGQTIHSFQGTVIREVQEAKAGQDCFGPDLARMAPRLHDSTMRTSHIPSEYLVENKITY